MYIMVYPLAYFCNQHNSGIENSLPFKCFNALGAVNDGLVVTRSVDCVIQ